MVDIAFMTDTPMASVCPWCSASLKPGAAACASCGANLISDEEHDLPGVTAVDQTVISGKKKPKGRSRLMAWISGEYHEELPSIAEAAALAPPDPDVQREIRRLALEAEVANLQAEAGALYAEAVAEGRVIDLPEGVAPFVATLIPPETLGGDATEAAPATSSEAGTPTDVTAPEGTAADDASASEDAPSA